MSQKLYYFQKTFIAFIMAKQSNLIKIIYNSISISENYLLKQLLNKNKNEKNTYFMKGNIKLAKPNVTKFCGNT